MLLSNVSSIAVTGVSRPAPTLTVDFAAGDPLVPSGVTFNGVAAAANTLNVADTGDVANNSFNVDASNVDVIGTAGTVPVTYVNARSINVLAGTGAETLTQLAQPGNGAALSFLNTTGSDSLGVINGTFTIDTGTAGAGIHSVVLGGLNLAAGTKVSVASPAAHTDRTVLTLTTLAIAAGTAGVLGQLDLGTNDLVLHNGNLAQVTNLIAGGYKESAGANWSGQGITSSAAASDTTHLTALGVELNNDGRGNRLFGTGTTAGLFDNQNAVLTDVIVKYTYFGDATLDGKVDGSDYARLDAGLASKNVLTGWANGDFNYDGIIDGTDVDVLDNAFNNFAGRL